MPADKSTESHGDEVLACVYAPDSKYVLSGGWDGCLRLWNAKSAAPLGKIEVANKPVSACAISPDGSQLVSGTLDGMLARWEADSHRQDSIFLAHTRPISCIAFATDRMMATASWDRTLIVWGPGRESRTLTGHGDIVAGCCFTPNSQGVLSWSHDNTVHLWDAPSGRVVTVFKEFTDRVMCGAVSPEGRYAAFGTRDKTLQLVDLITFKVLRTAKLSNEARCCMFLLDGLTLVAADSAGNFGLYNVPELKVQGALPTKLTVQCGTIAPSGAQIAVGCNDGKIHLVDIDGFDEAPLVVHMSQQTRRISSPLQRLFGKSSEMPVLVGTCPVCRATFEYPGTNIQSIQCPSCRRALRVGIVLPKQEV
jgi:WD40 repeat protein